MDSTPHNCHVTKKYEYVTFTITPMDDSSKIISQFTFHQVELKKLIPLLQKAVSNPVNDSFEELSFAFQEGAFMGPAPEKHELVEFMDPPPFLS